MNPERLAALEEERDFLLRSIRDLDAERAAGDVDEHDHAALRDGYVARAAAVLKELENGRRATVARPGWPLWQKLLAVGLTLAVAIGIGIFVAGSAGQRLPGQSLTGGQEVDEITRKLAEASQLLGTDRLGALKKYQEVLAVEPQNAEALTYTAWLTVLAGSDSQDPTLLAKGMDDLRAVIAIDDTYADAHCFLAVAAGRFLQPADLDLAASEGQACLDAGAPGGMRGMIQQMLGSLVTTETTTPATTPTTT